MAKFRMLLISLAAWQILLFNLERPDILSDGRSIDLASFVYVLAAIVMVGMLMLPDLGKVRINVLSIPILVTYGILKIIVSRYQAIDTLFVYITVTEIATLIITIWVARNVSVAVASFEDAVETTVLGTSKLRVLSMIEGEEQVNHELFRARRFDRPVSLLYLRNSLLAGMQNSFGNQFDLEAAFRRRYLQARIAQLVEAMTYRSDIIAWHNDNLVICLPETTKENAVQFAQQLHGMLKMRLNIDLKMGLATFPYDALIYNDLIDAALMNPVLFFDRLVDDDQAANNHRKNGGGSSERRETTELPPYHETQELEPLGTQTQELDAVSPMRIVRSLFSGPQLFPLDGVPLFQAQTGDLATSTDPDFWVNRLPYQSASSRVIYRHIKRAFDLVVVGITLPFAIVPMALIALAIRLSGPGPIFFRQQRTGIGGHRFAMFKFRTMVPDAEEKLKELAAQGLAKLDEEGKLAEPLKLKRDPRVTRIGSILRKTSLDEMPQILNVLRGDMSLVGPRPTSWNVDSYTLMQTERLSIRPGITGLWQVYSRGNTDFDNWLEWDMKYIEKMSFSLDIQILLRTALKVFEGSGAR